MYVYNESTQEVVAEELQVQDQNTLENIAFHASLDNFYLLVWKIHMDINKVGNNRVVDKLIKDEIYLQILLALNFHYTLYF